MISKNNQLCRKLLVLGLKKGALLIMKRFKLLFLITTLIFSSLLFAADGGGGGSSNKVDDYRDELIKMAEQWSEIKRQIDALGENPAAKIDSMQLKLREFLFNYKAYSISEESKDKIVAKRKQKIEEYKIGIEERIQDYHEKYSPLFAQMLELRSKSSRLAMTYKTSELAEIHVFLQKSGDPLNLNLGLINARGNAELGIESFASAVEEARARAIVRGRLERLQALPLYHTIMALSEEDRIPEILRMAREVLDCPGESESRSDALLYNLLDIGLSIDPNFNISQQEFSIQNEERPEE